MKEAINIIYIVIFIMFVALTVVFSSDLQTINKLTNGYTVVKMQQLKAECEKTLPRTQQCVIIVSAQMVKEK